MNLAFNASRMIGSKVLIIGDIMLDQYQKGLVERISPEAPVPVVKITEQIFKIGGFSGELLWNRLRYPPTGTTATRVVKCALHTLTFTSSGATIIHIIATGRTADWSRERTAASG